MPSKATAPIAALIQNSTWKSACSATKPASGSPSAPPMPSIALTSAIDDPTFSRGIAVESRLMPNGMAAADTPWMPRPTMRTAMSSDSAVTNEPSARAPIAASSIRRLPNMSPSRPMIGTETAATSRVEVNSQLTFVADVSSRPGRIESTGTRIDWDSDTASAPRPTSSSTRLARAPELSSVLVRPVLVALIGSEVSVAVIGSPLEKRCADTIRHKWHSVSTLALECQLGYRGVVSTVDAPARTGGSLRDRARDAIRDEVLTRAWLLFAEQGFAATTIEQVAEAAGMSFFTFFRYFRSKDELLSSRLLGVGYQRAAR